MHPRHFCDAASPRFLVFSLRFTCTGFIVPSVTKAGNNPWDWRPTINKRIGTETSEGCMLCSNYYNDDVSNHIKIESTEIGKSIICLRESREEHCCHLASVVKAR